MFTFIKTRSTSSDVSLGASEDYLRPLVAHQEQVGENENEENLEEQAEEDSDNEIKETTSRFVQSSLYKIIHGQTAEHA